MEELHYFEKFGSTRISNKYVITKSGVSSRNFIKQRWQGFTQFIMSVFLPQGYPESVSGDYLQYQFWDTIQAFSSGINGSLATRAVLIGVGVGNQSASILAASVTWLLKDGMGMIGRILFAYLQSSSLDSECKSWRFVADYINDISIFVDIFASHMPSTYFQISICLSSILRAIVAVAGGSTRAAITQHQARRNNMADVAAKDGSQETLVNLASMLCSIIILQFISSESIFVWILFLVFTFFHLFANYKAVSCLTMETFNRARFHIVASGYLKQICSNDFSEIAKVIGIEEANQKEPIIIDFRKIFSINIGCSLKSVNDQFNQILEMKSRLFSYLEDQKQLYLVLIDLKKRKLNVLLDINSTWTHQLRSLYQIEIIEFAYGIYLNNSFCENKHLNQLVHACSTGDAISISKLSSSFFNKTWVQFSNLVQQAGWKTEPVQLSADDWRVDWNWNEKYE